MAQLPFPRTRPLPTLRYVRAPEPISLDITFAKMPRSGPMATTKKTKKKTRQAKPKAPPRIRVAMKGPRAQDSEAIATFGSKLVAAAAANPTLFVNPTYIAALKTSLATLATCIVNAQGGTDAAQTALVMATSKTHTLISQHSGWVQSGADTLPAADAVSFITTAGFTVAKTGQRTPKTSPELSNAAPTIVHFVVPTIAGAIMWFTEVSTDGGKTFVRTVDTELKKGDITGLTSGQLISVRLRPFLRGKGYAPWTVLSIVVT